MKATPKALFSNVADPKLNTGQEERPSVEVGSNEPETVNNDGSVWFPLVSIVRPADSLMVEKRSETFRLPETSNVRCVWPTVARAGSGWR